MTSSHCPCVCVIAASNSQLALQQIKSVHTHADMIEWRVDALDTVDPDVMVDVCSHIQVPWILTLRPECQGGAFVGGEQDRLDLLWRLGQLSPNYIDIEYDVAGDWLADFHQAYPDIGLIRSWHDFEQTPDDLESLLDDMRHSCADVFKLVTTAENAIDVLRVAKFVKKHAKEMRLIAHCMGANGLASRVLVAILGNAWQYYSIDGDVAVGLPSLAAMRLYRFAALTPSTHVYGLIGDPVDHSVGHVFHNGYFLEHDVDAVYVKLQVSQELLAAFFSGMASLPILGLSVTMPLKQAVLPFVDYLSDDAQAMQAVNTLTFSSGKIHGDNTDGSGILAALEPMCPLKGKQFLLIGAGGAAKATVYALKQAGARLTVTNRSGEKAEGLAQVMDVFWTPWPANASANYDAIVVAVPMDESLLAAISPLLVSGVYVMAMDYSESALPLQRHAESNGCCFINGKGMFDAQAFAQLAIWLS